VASLKIRTTVGLLLALVMVGCSSAAPSEPAAASTETERADVAAKPPAPAAERNLT